MITSVLHLNSNLGGNKIVGTPILKLAMQLKDQNICQKIVKIHKGELKNQTQGHFKWPTIKTFGTIMCRNDELSWLFTKRSRAFYLICRKKSQTLLKISVIPILLVNNQLNSSLRHIIVTIDCSTWNDMGSQNYCCQYNPNKNCSGAPFMCTVD